MENKLPQDVNAKIESYIYKWPKEIQEAMKKDIEFGYSLAQQEIKERDEEIKRLRKIEFWTHRYEFSFQFWGEGQNNVYINKDDVEVASYGGENTIKDILELTINWCEKSNPQIKYPNNP